jgi:hypothetical protein
VLCLPTVSKQVLVALTIFTACGAAPALAQGSTQQNYQVPSGTPYVDPLYQQGAPTPPPVGSGSTPTAVTQGDPNGAPNVPTGTADPTNGSNFQVTQGQDRTIARLYIPNDNTRGVRYVLDIRADQLSAANLSAIQGILGQNLMPGNADSVDIQVTTAQLEQIQAVLAPYPGFQMTNGRKQIVADQPAAGYPKPGEDSLYAFDGTLPTVQTFCRYLVILGVVAGTVFMALAAWSMCAGNPYGGARAMGSAAGVFMLLGAYTIWKIVQMNTFNANSATPAISQNRPQTDQVPSAFQARPNVPITPTYNPTGPARGGVPVVPEGAAGGP